MATARFLALGGPVTKDGITAIQLVNDWRLVVFHSAEQGIQALRDAGVSAEEVAYWRSQLRRGHFPTEKVKPAITISGSAASLVGMLLMQLNGRPMPAPTKRTGHSPSLAIFRVPIPGSEATDGMMGVRGEVEIYQVFFSRAQAFELLQNHRSWLGEEAYQQHMAVVEASPLATDTTRQPTEITGYPAWLINEMLEHYEKARLAQERRRQPAN